MRSLMTAGNLEWKEKWMAEQSKRMEHMKQLEHDQKKQFEQMQSQQQEWPNQMQQQWQHDQQGGGN